MLKINNFTLFFNNLNLISLLYLSVLIVVLLLLILNIVFTKKYLVINSVQLALQIFLLFLYNESLNYLFIIISIVSLSLSILLIVLLSITYTNERVIFNTTKEHLKNDSTSFFLTLNSKRMIIDYSKSISDLTHFTKKEIEKKNGFELLLKDLPVVLINGGENIAPNVNQFLNHLNEVKSTHNMYNFTLDLNINNEHHHYNGLIDPIYPKNKKNSIIGYNIYLYIDKHEEINKLRDYLMNLNYSLTNFKNVLHTYMSLTSSVCLYYDYEENLYFATNKYMKLANNDTIKYSFEDIYNSIHPDDIEEYNEMAKTINSLMVTRLKYRLLINNEYYNVIEDSCTLSKDGNDFVSLIHVISKYSNNNEPRILSTKESNELLDSLSKEPISSTITSTKDILNSILGDIEDEHKD